MFVCDYAWSRPNPAAIRAAGFVAVCRYLSHDRTGKTLTPPEAEALHAAGLGVVLNFEDSAGRMLGGAAAGVSDARFANALADSLGAPRNVPIYYSCDTDPGAPPRGEIQAYVHALVSVGIRPVGVYGGAVLVQWALGQGVSFGWTANAGSWNHGVAPCGHLHQVYSHPAGTPTIAGCAPAAYDVSQVLQSNFGAWGGIAASDVPAPPPSPTMTVVHDDEEEAPMIPAATFPYSDGNLHTIYVDAKNVLWHEFSGPDGKVHEESLTAILKLGPVKRERPIVSTAPDGDLNVTILGADEVLNDCRFDKQTGHWTLRTGH